MSTQALLYALSPRPTFLEGMGRVLDLGCTMLNADDPLLSDRADAIALFSDWIATGDDLRSAIGIYDKKVRQD